MYDFTIVSTVIIYKLTIDSYPEKASKFLES